MPLVNKRQALELARKTLQAFEDDRAGRDELQGALLECRDAARHYLDVANNGELTTDDKADAALRLATVLRWQSYLEAKLASPLDPTLRCEVGRKTVHDRCPTKAKALVTYPSGSTLRMCPKHSKARRDSKCTVQPLEA